MAFCGKYGKPLWSKCGRCREGRGGQCHNRYYAPWLEVGGLIAWLLLFIGLTIYYCNRG